MTKTIAGDLVGVEASAAEAELRHLDRSVIPRPRDACGGCRSAEVVGAGEASLVFGGDGSHEENDFIGSEPTASRADGESPGVGPQDLGASSGVTLGAPMCEAYPLGPYRTSNTFIFLREILQQENVEPGDEFAAGNCLRQWLANSINSVPPPNGSAYSTLIVDQTVRLTAPIVLPQRFTLSGVGADGAGRLIFSGLGLGVAAITVLGDAYSTICDLRIEYLGLSGNPPLGRVGLRVGNPGDLSTLSTIVYIRRVRFTNWAIAVDCYSGYSTILDQCLFIDNRMHVRLGAYAFGPRIRECYFQGAGFGALRVNVGDAEPPNGLFVSGCTFQNNSAGIVVGNNSGAVIMGNRFSGNNGVGIRVMQIANQVRIVGNHFTNGDRFIFDEANIAERLGEYQYHQYGFNSVSDIEDEAVLRDQNRLAVESIRARLFFVLP